MKKRNYYTSIIIFINCLLATSEYYLSSEEFVELVINFNNNVGSFIPEPTNLNKLKYHKCIAQIINCFYSLLKTINAKKYKIIKQDINEMLSYAYY